MTRRRGFKREEEREIILSREIDKRHHLDDGHLNILVVRVPPVTQSGRQANDTIDRASANKKNRSGFLLLEYRGRRRRQICKRSKIQNGET
jgi:hypothetical protein